MSHRTIDCAIPTVVLLNGVTWWVTVLLGMQCEHRPDTVHFHFSFFISFHRLSALFTQFKPQPPLLDFFSAFIAASTCRILNMRSRISTSKFSRMSPVIVNPSSISDSLFFALASRDSSRVSLSFLWSLSVVTSDFSLCGVGFVFDMLL